MNNKGGRNELALAIVSVLALGLSACSSGGGNSSAPPLQIGDGGGGGGGTTPTPTPTTTPPPTTPPTGPVNAQPPIDAHLKLIGADQAKAAGYTGSGVTIGIIDSGVRRDHPTLAGRVMQSFTHVGSGNDLSVDDKVGHGTTVASLAAGSAFGQWPGGVASGANIVSSRIIADQRPVDDGSGQGNEVRAGQGYGAFFRMLNLEMADAGARIINNSWGGLYWTDPAMTDEFAAAYSDFIFNRDGLVVFANGNAGDDPRYRPNPSDNAALPSKSASAAFLERGWLSVAALNPTEATPTLTNYSQACGVAKNYCLTAPGNVVHTGFNDSAGNPTYHVGGGTSYAAPLVAGTAALVWGAFPYFNNDLVRQTILGTATDIGDEGVDEVFGYGLLNAAKAVRGPARFDWGDVVVEFPNLSYNSAGLAPVSVWGNLISGQGGLHKIGAGTLVLSERGDYAGDTRVSFSAKFDAPYDLASSNPRTSSLVLRQGLVNSNASIGPTGVLMGLDNFGGDVVNTGVLLAGNGSKAMSIAGNFFNGTVADNPSSGAKTPAIVSVWVGNPLGVDGTVNLFHTENLVDSRLHIGGVRPGYVSSSKELLIWTKKGVLGRFTDFTWDPKLVLFNARLDYDNLNVYLLTSRIDVYQSAQAWSFTGTALASARRVESAMREIDAQLNLIGATGASSAGFAEGLGALQMSQGIDGVNMSLRSLAGQLHGASSSLTYDSIDVARRAAAGRFDAFQRDALQAGGWYSDLSRNGTMSQAGFDAVGYSSTGEMIGHDVRMGHNGLLGAAFSRQQQTSWLPAFGDQVRGYQHEGQIYAGWLRDGWYSQGRVGVGQFSREMQRNVLLGLQLEGVATRLSGSYLNANVETGYRFDLSGFALTPYAGLQYTHLRNDGFAEVGAAGLGLRANAWDSQRGQTYAGFRAERNWRFANGLALGLDMRGEWQQRLLSQGDVFNASFVGVDNWQPLYGIALAERSQLHGVGMNAAWSKNLLRLDYSRRSSQLGDIGTASLLYRRRF
ncbi:MAG: S8 family serine peptidase [Pseudomonadota bacterium]|nr:S8 family serine peptidase [Pseudomonadota bacterium]